jgi:hypothetical protein
MEIHDYIFDCVNHTVNFKTWKVLYSKCACILTNKKNGILNENATTYYLMVFIYILKINQYL